MSRPRQYYVIGAGGHARVILSAIWSLGDQVVALLDDNSEKHGMEIAGVPVICPKDAQLANPSTTGVIGIGDNQIRKQIATRFSFDWTAVVHPSALVDPSVVIGRGSVVMAGAIIQAGTQVGEHCIINTGATVDHDCRIGDFCHVAPGVHLAGHCELESGVLLGIGSCMVPAVRVGEWATIGAGAAVVNDVPAGVVAVGGPARPRFDL